MLQRNQHVSQGTVPFLPRIILQMMHGQGPVVPIVFVVLGDFRQVVTQVRDRFLTRSTVGPPNREHLAAEQRFRRHRGCRSVCNPITRQPALFATTPSVKKFGHSASSFFRNGYPRVHGTL